MLAGFATRNGRAHSADTWENVNMKKVHKREMVAHLWANRSQDEARTPHGNFYFTGPTLYSYGSHFVCGHFMPDAYALNGRPLVLVNSNSYSVTTGRHMGDMLHALRGHRVEIIAVPGIQSGDVYGIDSRGARCVADTLIEAMRNAVTGAATSRRVQAKTRAACMATAQRYAESARHLLSVDASRRDLSADARKLARAALRDLPDTFPEWDADSGDAKEYAAQCVALAQTVARGDARDALRVALVHFDNLADKLESYLADPDLDGWNRIRDASGAVSAIHEAQRLINGAKESATIGRARIPAATLRRLVALRAHLPELEARATREARAENVRLFEARMEAARGHMGTGDDWRFRNAMAEARKYAARCATLDTEEEREARATELDLLQTKQDQWAAASAPERVAQYLLFAEDDATAGRFLAARFALNNARVAARAGGIAEDGIEAMAERVAALETEANAERIAAWRNGANVTIPHGDAPMLRIRGNVIETSWGAVVPADVAPLVWSIVRAARNAKHGTEFKNGPRLGSFRLDAVDENGNITAGCHVIAFEELQRMAAALNYEGAN